MVTAQSAAKPVRALGDFFAMSLDTFVQMFRPPWAWREFLLQTWFVARVSMFPTVMLAIPFCVLTVFTINVLLVEIGAADFSGTGAALGAVTQIGPIVTVLVIAGAGATAMCADLGARTIREELDALRVLGINPVPWCSSTRPSRWARTHAHRHSVQRSGDTREGRRSLADFGIRPRLTCALCADGSGRSRGCGPFADQLIDRGQPAEHGNGVVQHLLCVLCGRAADGVSGYDEVEPGLRRVPRGVGDGQVQRHPGKDDGRHAETLEHRKQLGIQRREQAVMAGQHEVILAQQLRNDRGFGGTGSPMRGSRPKYPPQPGRSPGLAAEASLVGRVDHLGPEGAGGIQKSTHARDEFETVGGQRGKHRFWAEHSVLAFDADDGRGIGVPGFRSHAHTVGEF